MFERGVSNVKQGIKRLTTIRRSVDVYDMCILVSEENRDTLWIAIMVTFFDVR
jgi:hypothetical protein